MSFSEQEFRTFLKTAHDFPEENDSDPRTNYIGDAPYPTEPPRNPRAELLMQNTGADISFGGSEAAITRRTTGKIEMPARNFFWSPGLFYGVMFHELGHWAGGIIQQEWMDHSSYSYAAIQARMLVHEFPPEEVVAEATSYFLSRGIGILDEDSAFHSTFYAGLRLKHLGMLPEKFMNDYYQLVRQRVDFLLSFDGDHPAPKPEYPVVDSKEMSARIFPILLGIA